MSDGGSAIRKAFQAALQHELNSLYQLMAQLDALAGHPLPAGMKPSPHSFGLTRILITESPPLKTTVPDILGPHPRVIKYVRT